MSTLQHDDPRLTAYALDELDDHERAAFEARFAGDPQLQAEIQAEVAQIRALTIDLEQELATALRSSPTLSTAQHDRIHHAAKQRPVVPIVTRTTKATSAWKPFVGWSIFTAAAAATIAIIILPALSPAPLAPVELEKLSSIQLTTIDSPNKIETPIQIPALRIADHEIRELTATTPSPTLAALSTPITKLTEADAETEVNKGREEAVASSETGSTGVFMAIGAGGRSVGSYSARTKEPTLRPQPSNDAVAEATIYAPVAAPSGEAYTQRAENGFQFVQQAPLSTFGLDVDTASYSNVRRMIESRLLPPAEAVRVEDMVNYFSYDIPKPQNGDVFGIMVEVTACPWQPEHQLARIAVRGKTFPVTERPALNLVFLVDVSGSMSPQNRLPLIKTGLSLLVNSLTPRDKVALVTYAGSAGVALPATPGSEIRTILKAIDGLGAGGGTNGAGGIQMAYDVAQAGLIPGGVNRVILCTDGDFNVGVTNRDALVQLAQTRAQAGVFLTVLGVGEDNLKDATMEQISGKANGNYHYLDTIAEARKVLVEQIGGTLVTIAKDAKAQIEFNPARVSSWRQVGYEKRQLAARDFNDDRKDAGEVGADHQVTMLYELVPAHANHGVPALRYQSTPAPVPHGAGEHSHELMTVKMRFKAPDGQISKLIQCVVTDDQVRAQPSTDHQFASAVAAFALRLRATAAMELTLPAIAALARDNLGSDPQGYRSEFVQLVERAAALSGNGVRE